MILAQLAGYSLIQIAILAIVIAGIIGVVVVITKQVGVAIPPWFIAILWIVVAVAIGVFAVRLLASLL